MQWEALVRRIEPQARENPKAYRRKVVLLAGLGYGFIAFMLLLLTAAAVLVVVLALKSSAILLKLLIPIVALVVVVGRSLWVKFPAPEGVALTRREVPELFRMLDDVRKAIDGPKVHRVLLDGEANAGVVQVPRAAGLLGSQNYLVLGLPYLEALSPEELRAVVAHELGHLSKRHGRFGSFVYRVRATWWQLLAGFEERKSIWTGLVRGFFGWYVPYFNAYTFPVARAHEFEADEAAAEAAGRDAAASSLVAGTLASRWLAEEYWPRVYERAADEPAPPRTAFAPLAGEIGSAKSFDGAERWYARQLEVEADVTDSHPSLAERIRAFGLDAHEVLRAALEPHERSAAQAYLGDAEARLVEEVDRRWSAEIAPAWREGHADAQRAKLDLHKLEERAAKGELPPEEALRRAELTESFRGEDEALARYRELLGSTNDALARYAVGRILLGRGDDEGLRFLDEAMDGDPEAVLPGCELAYEYLRARDRDEEAERYRQRAERQAEVLGRAAEERSMVSVDDRLDAPDLQPEVLDRVRRKIGWHEEVERAFLVRKRTANLDDSHPFYVVAVVPKSGFRAAWREADDDVEPLEDRVARDLDVPAELMVVKLAAKSPLAERFAAIDGAEIYSRS